MFGGRSQEVLSPGSSALLYVKLPWIWSVLQGGTWRIKYVLKSLKFEEFFYSIYSCLSCHVNSKQRFNIIGGNGLFLHFVLVSTSSFSLIKMFPSSFFNCHWLLPITGHFPSLPSLVTVSTNYLSLYSKQDKIVKWTLLDLFYWINVSFGKIHKACTYRERALYVFLFIFIVVVIVCFFYLCMFMFFPLFNLSMKNNHQMYFLEMNGKNIDIHQDWKSVVLTTM